MDTPPLFLHDLKHLIGKPVSMKKFLLDHPKSGDMEAYIVDEPRYDLKTGKYRCLANIMGALCLIEVNITSKGVESGMA